MFENWGVRKDENHRANNGNFHFDLRQHLEVISNDIRQEIEAAPCE